VWVDGAFYGGEGGYQLPGSWVPNPYATLNEQPGPVAPPVGQPGTTVPGVTDPTQIATTINKNWAPSAPLQAQLAALLTTRNSGYGANPGYMPPVSPGRFQFSATAPVPRDAPLGWGRYPGVDGAPGNAPWLAGQTAPRPVWGNTGGGYTPPTMPSVPPTPPPNYIGAPRTGGTGTTIAPPGTPRNPNSTPGYTNSTGTGGQTRVPLAPAPYNPGNVFTSPIQNVTGTSTVAQSTGRNYYNPQTFEHSIEALPQELQGAYIPPQYIGHALPAGAFKSLWPNSVGTDWVKAKPEGWSPTWRPTNTRG
jgi:hypothetical protein